MKAPWTFTKELGLALAMAAVILLGTATNDDTEIDQAVADDAAAAPAQALALAQADDLAFRSQHPSASQPVRRRHPSTQQESAQ